MKAEANSYVYILAAIGYIVYSVIKAAKKLNQNKSGAPKRPEGATTVNPPAAPPVTGQDSGEDLRKMLEDLLGKSPQQDFPKRQEQPVPQVRRPQHQPAKSTIPKAKKAIPQVKHSKPALAPKSKPVDAAPVFTAHPEVVQRAFVDTTEQEENTFDFDIREAVLYSEILKRPQY